MSVRTRGKCPNCHRFTHFKYSEVEGKVYWICENCGHKVPDDAKGSEQITWGGI